MQFATVIANKELEKRFKEGVDFKQVCFYHDEYTFEVRPEIAEDVKAVLEESINKAGNHFNLSIEQTGEGEIGNSWYDVHTPWWVGLFLMYWVAFPSISHYTV
jgi:DNA polymerase I-like protein with 3'-5' exonuclease and polymerase domains